MKTPQELTDAAVAELLDKWRANGEESESHGDLVAAAAWDQHVARLERLHADGQVYATIREQEGYDEAIEGYEIALVESAAVMKLLELIDKYVLPMVIGAGGVA